MRVNIIKPYKSIGVKTFDIPDFCVLTGKNGSGKSHLMQAMADNSYSTIVDETDAPLSTIKYIPFNGLNPNVESDCQYLTLTQTRKNEWHKISGAIMEFNQDRERNQRLRRDVFSFLPRYEKPIKLVMHKLIEKCGSIDNIQEDDFNQIYDISAMSATEIFTSQFASIFKLYHSRLEDNNYKSYRNEIYGEKHIVLSNEEFVIKYGPKPWDLINEMLNNASLPYRVNNPEGQGREDDFHLSLFDPEHNIEINVNDLSTGEKVLMSMALAIYNTTENDHKPDVLLLDEPDAPLHPEYSKVLLSAVYDSIVNKAGVKVIVTTHNPTTVAIAPEDSIYKMDKEVGYPVKITQKQALSILTKELDNVRISTDPRRQIFVENQNDAEYYERIIRQLPAFHVQLQFLPPHTKNGCNCDDVKQIVQLLRSMGNDSVYGIIDYDNHNEESDSVYVLGGPKRYAIDNYIFDPIYVGFLLVRENILSTAEMGIGSYTFTKLSQLSHDEIQSIVDYVSSELGLNSGETINYSTQNTMSFSISKDYFTIQGHELEDKIINKWPKLNSIKRGQHDERIFKIFMLDKIINEYPEFLSIDFIETFNKIS